MHKGRTYIVTGVTSGIGAETCQALKSSGAKVIGVDRNKTDIADEFYLADLSEPDSIADLIECLPEGANGLANIAGLPPTAPADLLMKVNLIGLRDFTNGVVDKLADGASIVNIASLAGFGWPDAMTQVKEALALEFSSDVTGFCAANKLDEGGRSYFLSKEALIVWTMQNRWTWRDRGIRMNTVSPGPVETPILKDFLETLGKRAEEDAKVMDRPGLPSDIAPVVSFLLSEGSGWIRGSNIATDGGMSSHIMSEVHQF
ncbi:MAG: SDR family oxidoreductase [Rhodobacteraceae bacterium]|nr:SDR family oxidoreductase [Paracoccaceae bacterium]